MPVTGTSLAGYKTPGTTPNVTPGPSGPHVALDVIGPTGNANTDTVNIQSRLNKAAEIGGVAEITKAGTYAINKELVRPATVSVVLGPNTVLQAVAGFEGEAVLSDLATEKSEWKSIIGGGEIDSNNIANTALFARNFGHMTFGVVCKNSLQNDCILGDSKAAVSSYEAYLLPSFWVNRTTGTVPAGGYCIWARNCSDGRMFGNVCKGQETGIRIDKGGWRGFGVHPYGAGFPMQVCIEDNKASEWHAPILDTPTPKTHAEAKVSSHLGEAIADPEILKQHEGRPVTGVGIPAGAYVGEVGNFFGPEKEFLLVNNKNEKVFPTGEVNGITLAGVGILHRENGSVTAGGEIFISATYGTDNGSYGIIFSPKTSTGTIVGFYANGGGPEFRVTEAFAGKTASIAWFGLIQKACVTNISGGQFAFSIPPESVGTEQLAPEAVTAPKIAAGAVSSTKIAAGGIAESNLAAGAVGTSKIANLAVTTAKIAAEAVNTEQIKLLSVSEALLGPESVSSSKIVALAVNGSKIAAGAITAEKIAAGAVGTAAIANLSVTTGKIALEAVGTEQIKLLSITEALLGVASVGTAKIVNESVTTAKLANLGVTGEKIALETITAEKLAASSVITSKINNAAVNAEKLAANAVESAKIATGAVVEAKIAALAVTTGKIAEEAVTPAKVKPGTTPAAGAENTVVVGTSGVARKIVAAIKGNGVATKFVVTHTLNTQTINGTVLSATFKQPVTMLAELVAISATEVEVIFTLAPGAGVITYAVLTG